HAAFAVPQGAAALGFAVAADPVGRVRPVPVGVAVEVVGDPAVVAAADHAQAVDAADDAFDVGAEDARVRIDLAVEVLDVAAQDAAFEVVRLRPGDQAEEHLPGLAIVVEDAGRLVDRVVGRAVGLAHALAQVGICVPATAGLHPDQVILAAGRARAVLPEQAPAVVAGGLFVAELDGVDARAERDARRVAVEAAVAAVVRVATVPAHDVVAVDEQVDGVIARTDARRGGSDSQ